MLKVHKPAEKGICWVRLSHARRAISARFDDPNLVSCAGLVPVMALAQRCGLAALLAQRLTITAKGGANAAAKILAVVAGMIAGADAIDDLDLLRHGGMSRLFAGVRAPSTLGTFLRCFTFGHVRQLDAVAAGLLARLVAAAPVLPDADQLVFVDVDDTVRQTYGYAKQGRRTRLHRHQGLECAARGRVYPGVGAVDRGHPTAQRIDELRPWRGEAAG